MLIESERLPHDTLDSVPGNGTACRPDGDSHAQSRMISGPFAGQHGEKRVRGPDWLPEHTIELLLAAKPASGIEGTGCDASHGTNGPLVFAVLGRESGPALGASAGQDLAPALGGHACPETMIALSAQIARLEGALHRSTLDNVSGPSEEVWPMDKRAEMLRRRDTDVKTPGPHRRLSQPVDNPVQPV